MTKADISLAYRAECMTRQAWSESCTPAEILFTQALTYPDGENIDEAASEKLANIELEKYEAGCVLLKKYRIVMSERAVVIHPRQPVSIIVSAGYIGTAQAYREVWLVAR